MAGLLFDLMICLSGEDAMKKVLLASGYTLFLRKQSNLLMRMGFQIFAAAKGSVALTLHEKHGFDLIILDCKLEDMSSPAFCSLIRTGNATPQVPIIIACHNIPGSIERASTCGADSLVIKPVEPVGLIELIGTYLGLQLVRSRRVDLRVAVSCKSQDLEFPCVSRDISSTGMLLETEYGLDVGRRITCRFTLPNDCPVAVDGVITRFKTAPEFKNLYGIQFVEAPLPRTMNIDTYIATIPTDLPPVMDSPLARSYSHYM
jgi:CheY-like chemotaxis protein